MSVPDRWLPITEPGLQARCIFDICQKTASLGFLRQFGSALRCGFADFLRKIRRAMVFFP